MSASQKTIAVLLCCAIQALGCGGRGVVGSSDTGPEATGCGSVETVEVFGFEIFKYEASRPNAKASRAGSGSNLPACSRPDVMPWSDLTRDEAQVACERSTDPESGEGGFGLCSFEDQWNLACGGSGNLIFPYGNVFRANQCNDHKSGSGGVEPADSRADCESPYGAIDMVGNIWEWVSDETGDGNPTYAGGSFEVTAIAPTADDTCNLKLHPQIDYHREPVGFRCCRDLD